VALIVGLWLFQPWRIVTSSTIDEPDPTVAVPEPETSTPPAEPAEPAESKRPTPRPTSPPPPKPKDKELARGQFEDAEHGTSGTAVIRQLADGRTVLRLQDLDTSDGPDLHVWITDQASGGSWDSYDDGRYVKLGVLKANRGNQNYVIPADADLAGLTSVVIWCDRFNVAFGSAPVDL
jgi:hypothetical protein